METWIVILIAGICGLIGYSFGFWWRNTGKTDGEELVGVFLIDKVHPEDSGGVYSQFFRNPQTFTDGEIVKVGVMHITEEYRESQ